VRKTFSRNPYTVINLDNTRETDLTELSALAKYNSNYKYLLNVIDVFSRYAWSVPLKHKTGRSVATALATIFQDRKPYIMKSDKGTEFVNATVQQYLKREGTVSYPQPGY
jgi:transposase InsO family protein